MCKQKNKITLVVLILCILLSGCSLNPEKKYGLSSDKPISIEIWHYYNGDQKIVFDKMINEFNKTVGKEKGIVVKASSQGSFEELAGKIMNIVKKEVGASKMPNIFMAYPDTAYTLDKHDLLANISKYMNKEEIDEYVDGYIDEGRINNDKQIKIFPIAKSTEVMIINKTIWDKFKKENAVDENYLSTWEGLSQVSEKYYNWSGGKSFFGRDSMANYMIIGSKQLGKEIVEVNDGKVKLNLDEEIIKKLWDNFYIPYINGYYGEKGKFRTDDIKTEDIVALVGSTSASAYFPEKISANNGNTYRVEAEVLPTPNFKDSESYMVQQGAGMAINKSDESHEYASVLFLKWITDKDRNLEFAMNSGYLPVKKEASSIDVIKKEIDKNNEVQNNEVVSKSLIVSSKEINENKLYRSKAFKGGEKVRNILEYSMYDKAKSDLGEINKKVKFGMNREKIIKEYESYDNFKIWFNDFKEEMMESVL